MWHRTSCAYLKGAYMLGDQKNANKKSACRLWSTFIFDLVTVVDC